MDFFDTQILFYKFNDNTATWQARASFCAL